MAQKTYTQLYFEEIIDAVKHLLKGNGFKKTNLNFFG